MFGYAANVRRRRRTSKLSFRVAGSNPTTAAVRKRTEGTCLFLSERNTFLNVSDFSLYLPRISRNDERFALEVSMESDFR